MRFSSSWEPAQLARQARRQDRYQYMLSHHQQGIETEEIAKQVGVRERTIRRRIMTEGLPKTRRRKKQSRFDAYAPYVLKRWPEGCHDAKQIWQELRVLGYQNSLHAA